MSDNNGAVPLKKTMNPKTTRSIAELKDIDINDLTPREQILYRVINSLEEELEEKKDGRDS